MNRILGLPRNAALAILAVVIAALSLTVAVVIPWNQAEAPSRPAASRSATTPATLAQTKTQPSQPPVAIASIPGGPEATRITVDFDDLPAGDGAQVLGAALSLNVRAIARQGVPVPARPVSLHLRDVPAMEAILQFARITQLEPYDLTAQAITFRPNNAPTLGRWYLAGPFAVVLHKIELSTSYGEGILKPHNPAPVLTMSAFAEPAANPHVFGGLAWEQIVDDKDQNVVASPTPLPGSDRTNQADYTSNLTLPNSASRRIALIRGRIAITFAAGVETIATSAPDDAIAKSVGGLLLQVAPLTQRESAARMPNAALLHTTQIRIQRGTLDEGTWAGMAGLLSPMQVTVLNANDRIIGTATCAIRKDTPDSLLGTLSVRDSPTDGAPHHVRFKIPTDIKLFPLVFEFRDIALP